MMPWACVDSLLLGERWRSFPLIVMVWPLMSQLQGGLSRRDEQRLCFALAVLVLVAELR